ncbi:Cytoplasmic protein [Mycena kentingensis (nom. inval.)]|nr:Cytoplasmic protein [Mycena kentingensis (nom. inval.)]
MSTPHYRLPIELCERVIDDLESDRHTLGACALVCSNWTQRSRFQLFSTTHVSESNARQFLELLASSSSVRSYITHLTIDIPSASHLLKIAAHPAFGRLSSVQTLHIRNIDWTSLPLANQLALERYLAQLQNTSTLVLDGVTFHDLAALLRAASAFSRVARVRLVGVEFSKYLQSNLALARASARRVPGELAGSGG